MTESILTSTKKILDLEESYTAFDLNIMTHINSVFSTLNQLGIGPPEGYRVEDATDTWADFIGTDPRLLNVKTYTFLRVKLLFDPPPTSFHTTSLKEQIQELEWRLNVQREETAWVSPDPDELPDDLEVIDGGSA